MSSRSSSNSDISFPGFYHVGFVRSAHGIRGELSIRLFAAQADWLENAQQIALLKVGQSELTTFAAQELRPHKDGLIAKLEGLVDRNASEAWKSAQVYISVELLQSEPGERIYLNEVQGFTVVDPQGQPLGKVVGFSSNGDQDLLQVQTPKHRSLVPFIDEFIVEIDFAAQTLSMDLPEGLLDIEDR